MKHKRMILVAAILACALCIAACTGTEANEKAGEDETTVINPLPENVSNERQTARLYFGYLSEPLLVGETRVFTAPDNESTEVSIVKELINGPSATRVDFVQLINPETTLVDSYGDGRYLTLTFSSEFIEPFGAAVDEEENQEYEKTRRYLAVYSIVNSVIEQGGFSRVRILVDENDSGTGRLLTYEEAGMDGSGATEPFGRNGDIVLSAKNTMREILQATEKKDWNTLYGYIAYKNASGQDRPSLDVFSNEVVSSKLTLSSPVIIDDVLLQDGATAIVMVDYVLKLGDDEATGYTNVPVRMVLENDVWKITYSVFKTNFLT
ncbi:MAG: GerMN domain-containing protein [Christensenellaceae bacterium]|jgi:hypothetical protein